MKFWEVLGPAIEDKKKLRFNTWADDVYIQWNGKKFICPDGFDWNCSQLTFSGSWEFYEPTVKFGDLNIGDSFRVKGDDEVCQKINTMCEFNFIYDDDAELQGGYFCKDKLVIKLS